MSCPISYNEKGNDKYAGTETMYPIPPCTYTSKTDPSKNINGEDPQEKCCWYYSTDDGDCTIPEGLKGNYTGRGPWTVCKPSNQPFVCEPEKFKYCESSPTYPAKYKERIHGQPFN